MSETDKRLGPAASALILVVLAVAIGVALITGNDSPVGAGGTLGGSSSEAIPRIVDLGARNCIPCKLMAQILDELSVEYRGQFDVVFIDLFEDQAAVEEYDVRIMPTQVFFDSEGKELYRHEGFFSKEAILGKWSELGMEFSATGVSDTGNG